VFRVRGCASVSSPSLIMPRVVQFIMTMRHAKSQTKEPRARTELAVNYLPASLHLDW